MASHRRNKKNTKAAHHNTDLITLDSFEVLGKNHVINSPRSIEACLRLGLDTADLVPKELSDYGGKFIPDFVAQVKYEHAEQRRVSNLKEAVRERNMIIQANSGSADMSASVPSGGGGGGGIVQTAPLTLAYDEPVELAVFLDGYMLEVFANNRTVQNTKTENSVTFCRLPSLLV